MKSENPIAVHVSALCKSFRTGLRRKRTIALRGLDLDVSEGEIFGFLGPNGAGKTTTIKILAGLLRPDAGRISLFGRSPRDARARRRMSYLPEQPDFYDYLRPAEFLTHCGRLSGMDPALLRQRVPELLDKVGLDPQERRQLRKFSRGMLQRVGVAQVMIADPDLYILDEPMGGLDPLGRRWIKDLIIDLGRAGKTVFFSSHILSEAEIVCDRVAFLDRGRLIAQGRLDELLATSVGTWEIVVAGHDCGGDEEIAASATSILPLGSDTKISVEGEDQPNRLLRLLLSRGRRIVSLNRQHSSLEDVFVRTLAESPAGKEIL